VGASQVTAVVIDTNVVVSALLFGGKPGQLVSHWQDGLIRPYASEAIIAEYLRVLAYPRFDLSENHIAYLIYQQILPFFEIVPVQTPAGVICGDPEDDKFLHCAVAVAARFIISGDHHLLNLSSYGNIPIVTVSAFLEAISADRPGGSRA
jgi:putative PIN family toxin of toxin-antitoxin system